MNLPYMKWTVGRTMLLVAVVAALLAVVDQVTVYQKARKYQRKADYFARELSRCREIMAMDSDTRARKAIEAWESFDEYERSRLENIEWTRQLAVWLDLMEHKYRGAAVHPRVPIPPDSMNP